MLSTITNSLNTDKKTPQEEAEADDASRDELPHLGVITLSDAVSYRIILDLQEKAPDEVVEYC